jgi:hypothetical protein
MKLKSRKIIGLGKNLEFAPSSNLMEHPSFLRMPGLIESEWIGGSLGKRGRTETTNCLIIWSCSDHGCSMCIETFTEHPMRCECLLLVGAGYDAFPCEVDLFNP